MRLSNHSISWVLVLLVLLSWNLTGCERLGLGGDDEDGQESAAGEQAESTEPGNGEESDKGQSSARKEKATSITAARVVQGDLVLPIVAEGTIRARHATDIHFEVGGRVEKIYINEGDHVWMGRKMVQLDNREYQVALEEAKSRYIQALGQLAVERESGQSDEAQKRLTAELAELDELERTRKITREERLERELQLGIAAVKDGAYRRELMEGRSGLAAARADESRAQLNLERTRLLAPFAGSVSGLTLSEGQRVQAGDIFCTVVDEVHIEAEIGVLESDLGALTVGRSALLTLPSLGQTIEVQVDVISPRIDAASRTCKVLLRLDNEDGRVKPGMFVRAAIAGEVHHDRILVPREAVLSRDGRPMLFKVDGDRARWVYVETGDRNDHLVEIKRVLQGGPLDPGTLVVVDNHLTLTHDAMIKVKETVETSDPWSSVAAAGR